MPLPHAFAIAAEQALIENASLACKDAPVLWALSSSVYSVQVEFYLLVLVCHTWPIFCQMTQMTTYLPPTEEPFFLLYPEGDNQQSTALWKETQVSTCITSVPFQNSLPSA